MTIEIDDFTRGKFAFENRRFRGRVHDDRRRRPRVAKHGDNFTDRRETFVRRQNDRRRDRVFILGESVCLRDTRPEPVSGQKPLLAVRGLVIDSQQGVPRVQWRTGQAGDTGKFLGGPLVIRKRNNLV